MTRTHSVPLVLKIPWQTGEYGGDLLLISSDRLFFRGKEGPFPSLISALAVSRLCHRLCSDCGFRHLYLPTWFWPKKGVPNEYIQLSHEAYMHNLLQPYATFISLHLTLLKNRKHLIQFFSSFRQLIPLQTYVCLMEF